nr:hypothetical protein [Tanacetum cinerariifolium]
MVAPKEVIMVCLDNTKWLRQGDDLLPFQTNAIQKLYTAITESNPNTLVGVSTLAGEAFGGAIRRKKRGRINLRPWLLLLYILSEDDLSTLLSSPIFTGIAERQQEIEMREAAARSLEDAIKSENAGTPAKIYKKNKKKT